MNSALCQIKCHLRVVFSLLLRDSYGSLAVTADVAPAPKTIIIEAT
jgi:hypothetical protein